MWTCIDGEVTLCDKRNVETRTPDVRTNNVLDTELFPKYLPPTTPPMGPETSVRASSFALMLMVPPWLAITRTSKLAPFSLIRLSTSSSVWRDGSAAYASMMVVLVLWVSLRTG